MFASIRITRLDVAHTHTTSGFYLGFTANDDEFWSVVTVVKSLPTWVRYWDAQAPGGRAWWIDAAYIDMLYPSFPGLRERVATLSGRKQEAGPRGGTSKASSVPSRVADAFASLHLMPSAPAFVVSAAYRALAKVAHPDVGGNTQAMQQLNAAYEVASEWAKK